VRVTSTVSLASAALMRNRLRSLLTTLGIVIGVAAVVMMQAMGQGASAYVGEAISGLGTNMLWIEPGSPKTNGPPAYGIPLFTIDDVEAVRRRARDVGEIAPISSRILRIVAGSNNRSVNVFGVPPGYFEIRRWTTSKGRLFSDTDDRHALEVCVVGQTVADALFGTQDPVGQEIRVRDIPCRVIGVLEAKGASFGMDQDDIVFLPLTTMARRIIGNERVGFIMASAIATDRIDDARREITEILRQRRHILASEDDDFAVRDPREIQQILQTVTGILTLVLAGVAAISLVVGGIGIMNIMLVSVTERTREIGIRLAIGARAGDVLLQFLVEATILSVVGGVIGIGFGLGGASAIAHVIHIPFVIPMSAIPLAVGVSVLVGVIFGVYPARRASRLSPLAALRYE
jgi:putative ABC transport system permease protein